MRLKSEEGNGRHSPVALFAFYYDFIINLLPLRNELFITIILGTLSFGLAFFCRQILLSGKPMSATVLEPHFNETPIPHRCIVCRSSNFSPACSMHNALFSNGISIDSPEHPSFFPCPFETHSHLVKIYIPLFPQKSN